MINTGGFVDSIFIPKKQIKTKINTCKACLISKKFIEMIHGIVHLEVQKKHNIELDSS